MELKRCFIALDLPREVINEIRRIQKLIGRKFIFNGKFTEPENLHLTLKFLGEIDSGKIEKVKKKLRGIDFLRFNVRLGNVGVFSKKFPKIIWVELKGVDELQKEVDRVLRELFEVENRFMGHITIARVKYIKEKDELIKYLKSLRVNNGFKVDKFFLKESELMAEGPVYRVVEEYELKN